MSGRSKVIIVGGGFGGLCAAQTLKSAPVDVTLIDRHNYHLFQPLLYQVATGSLSAGEIAAPLRSCLWRAFVRTAGLAHMGVHPSDVYSPVPEPHSGFNPVGNPRSDLQSRGTADYRGRSY